VSDDWQKTKDRARPLRDWAADARGLAGKMKTDGARKGLIELAAYYDGRADEVDALIRQMTGPRPDPGLQAPAPTWQFRIPWRVGGDPRASDRAAGVGSPVSFGAMIFALRTVFLPSQASERASPAVSLRVTSPLPDPER
jgi:hypothetical protein